MDCAGGNRQHGYSESAECRSCRLSYGACAEVGLFAHPDDLVNFQLGAAGRCVRLLGAAVDWGDRRAPTGSCPCVCHLSHAFRTAPHADHARDRRSRGDSRQTPEVGAVMKRFVKHCGEQRMLRAPRHRWPYRCFRCTAAPHGATRPRASRRRCRQGRSHSLPNLNYARHNRPHNYRPGDTDNGL
jgi:hypothetical protein